MQHVTIVLVMDSNRRETHPTPQRVSYYLQQLAFLVFQEEMRSKFLSKEAYRILKLKEQLKLNGQRRDKKLDVLLRESYLVRDLMEFFEALDDVGTTR